MKNPRGNPEGRLPPMTSRAPSRLPMSIYSSTVFNCCALTTGPIWSRDPGHCRFSISQSARLRRRNEFIGDRILNDGAACGGAALPGRTERSGYDSVRRKVQIRILQNDDGILSAHFALRFHAAHRAGSVNLRAVIRRSRKRDAADAPIAREHVSHFGTAADKQDSGPRAAIPPARKSPPVSPL